MAETTVTTWSNTFRKTSIVELPCEDTGLWISEIDGLLR
jgi:hypothetical protein